MRKQGLLRWTQQTKSDEVPKQLRSLKIKRIQKSLTQVPAEEGAGAALQPLSPPGLTLTKMRLHADRTLRASGKKTAGAVGRPL